VIEPYVRFAGREGEQARLFVRDPSTNYLEVKAFRNIEMLFDKDFVLHLDKILAKEGENYGHSTLGIRCSTWNCTIVLCKNVRTHKLSSRF